MKIICIDFETANPFWGSICAVGVAVIEGGKITETMNEFIKPHPEYAVFNKDNIRVHGIKPDMVKNAREFDVFYPRIKGMLEGGIMAAHNTSFDVDCIRDVLTLYNIPIPSFEHVCTCELAEKAWKGLDSYRLKSVSKFLEYKYKAHDAGEDALAAANIILKAMEKEKVKDIRELAAGLGVKIRAVHSGELYELSSVKREKRMARRVDARTIKAEKTDFNTGHAFYNKELVFTGELINGMSRMQAMQNVVNAGAKLCNYVRYATDYLVTGVAEAGGESTKTRRAKKMIESGSSGIQIIGEKEFLKLLAL